jgi:hypothetical protein
VESQFEFEHNGRRFNVQSEMQPTRGLHDLYYRGHFLQTQLSTRDATQAEVMVKFIAWLADHPVSPYECHGGPLDGQLVDDSGPGFVLPDFGGGRYRRQGDDCEWEQ